MSLTVKDLEKLQSQLDGDYRLELIDGEIVVKSLRSNARITISGGLNPSCVRNHPSTPLRVNPPRIEYFQQSVMYGSCTRLITNYELRITNYLVTSFR